MASVRTAFTLYSLIYRFVLIVLVATRSAIFARVNTEIVSFRAYHTKSSRIFDAWCRPPLVGRKQLRPGAQIKRWHKTTRNELLSLNSFRRKLNESSKIRRRRSRKMSFEFCHLCSTTDLCSSLSSILTRLSFTLEYGSQRPRISSHCWTFRSQSKNST